MNNVTYRFNGEEYNFPEGTTPEQALELYKTIPGNALNGGQSEVKPGIKAEDLYTDHNWLNASLTTFRQFEGRDWDVNKDGDDSYLATYGLDRMRWLNSNLIGAGIDGVRVKMMPDDAKQAFGHLMETYENVNTSWEGVGKSLAYQAADPTNWSGLLSMGAGTAASQAAKITSKEVLKEALRYGLREATGQALQGAAFSGVKQNIEMDVGNRDEFSYKQLALDTGISAGAGLVLGGGLNLAGVGVKKLLKSGAAAGEAEMPSVVPSKAAEVPASPEATPVAPTPANVPDGVVPKPEIPSNPVTTTAADVLPAANDDLRMAANKDAAQFAPDQNTVVLDKPEVKSAANSNFNAEAAPNNALDGLTVKAGEAPTPANANDIARVFDGSTPKEQSDSIVKALKDYTSSTGFQIFNRSAGEFSEAVRKAGTLLSHVTPGHISQVADEVTRMAAAGEQVSSMKYMFAQSAQKIWEEVNDLTRQIAKEQDVKVRTDLETKRKSAETIRKALIDADKRLSSNTGVDLQARKGNLNTGERRDVTVESWLHENGIDPAKATPEQYADAEKQHWDWMVKAEERVKANAEIKIMEEQIDDLVKAGKYDEAQVIAKDKELKAKSIAEKTPDTNVQRGYAAFNKGVRMATEWAVGLGMFSPATVIVNLLPHVVNVTAMPLVDFAARGFDGMAFKQMLASYGAMYSQLGKSLQAARATFALERSMLDGFHVDDLARIMEQEFGWKGTKGRLIRLIPRLASATDAGFSTANYRSYIAAEAVAQGMKEASSLGLTGDAFNKHIKDTVTRLTAASYGPSDGATVMSFLRKRGMEYGYKDAKLDQWVSAQLNTHPDLLQRATNELGRDYADDLAYRRAFSGDSGISKLASGYEKFVNDNPIMRFLGQPFFRTPVRISEQSLRMLPGVQAMMPNFLSDLAGKGRGGVGGYAQVRARSNVLLGQAIMAYSVYAWSTGNLKSGGPDNFKNKRTVQNNPDWSADTIRTDEGTEYSYRKLAPYSMPMRVITNCLDQLVVLQMRKSQGEFVDDKMTELVATAQVASLAIVGGIRDDNLLGGLNEIYKTGQALSKPEDSMGAIGKLIGSKLQMFVPATPSKVMQAFQDERPLVEAPGLGQSVMAKAYPQSGLVPKRHDAMGYTVYNPNNPVAAIFGMDYSTKDDLAKTYADEKHMFVAKELASLAGKLDTNFEPPADAGAFGGEEAHGWKGVDLRTQYTADGKETWFDRLNRYTSETGVKDKLYDQLSKANQLAEGTRVQDGPKVAMIREYLKAAREQAFHRLTKEELEIKDKAMKAHEYDFKVKRGQLDSPFGPFR